MRLPPASELRIRYRISYKECNLRCPYCIIGRSSLRGGPGRGWPARLLPRSLRAGKTDPFNFERFRKILMAIQALPYSITLHLGFEGEAFTSLPLLDEIAAACNGENSLRSVSLLTNLQADWESVTRPFLDRVRPDRFSLGCTLHDTVIADVLGFFEKVRKIKELGFQVYVTYVAVPDRIPNMSFYRQRCTEMGVTFAPNALIGKLPASRRKASDAAYPGAYTPQERQALRAVWDNPHSYMMLVGGSPRGMACSAGSGYIHIDDEGEAFPCSKIPTRLGNVLNGIPRLFSRDVSCPSDRCWCGNQNQALRIVDKSYNRTLNIRILEPKPDIPSEALDLGYNSLAALHT